MLKINYVDKKHYSKMGQQEVYRYLKKVKDWRTTSQIAKAIKAKGSGLSRVLGQMLRYKEVESKQVKIRVGKRNGFRLVTIWRIK